MATAKKRSVRAETEGLSAEEIEAMKETMAERKSRGKGKVDGNAEVLAKIAGMKGNDKAMAERIHAIVTKAAPQLEPRTWYGMPAYAKDGKAVVFFQDAAKFKARYATLGFNDGASLDDGNMWPTSYALVKLTAADEARITALVKKAAG